jgi:hypothetical protein
MKKLLLSLFACLALSTVAWGDSSTTKLAKLAKATNEPVKLSAQQLDRVSAGYSIELTRLSLARGDWPRSLRWDIGLIRLTTPFAIR